MRWRGGLVALVVVLVGCLEATTGISDEPSEAGTHPWESWSVGGIKAVAAGQPSSFFMARADSAFRMGLLTAASGSTVGLTVHRDNAVYYVAAGRAQLRISGDTIPLAAGTVVFVPGDTEHRIHDITAELDIVAYLARGLTIPGEPEAIAYTAEELRGPSGQGNAWRPLVLASTLGMGVYTLPKGGGGDDGLAHAFAEYKVVMEGGGRFDIGDGGIEAAPGSMVLIPHEIRHQFRRVSDDLVVLVVWKR